jgi:hypothetical protein
MVGDVGEGDVVFSLLELHLQGCEISEDVAEVGRPWRADDNVNVDADVH